MWFLGPSLYIQLNTFQLLIVFPSCSSSGATNSLYLVKPGINHEQQYKISMLEPSSEDISHLLVLLFPQISLSGLKSPL